MSEHIDQGLGLWSKIHVEFYVSQQAFSYKASDWLAAVLPANQMPGLQESARQMRDAKAIPRFIN